MLLPSVKTKFKLGPRAGGTSRHQCLICRRAVVMEAAIVVAVTPAEMASGDFTMQQATTFVFPRLWTDAHHRVRLAPDDTFAYDR